MSEEAKSNGRVPDGPFPFQMPDGLCVKSGVARKMSSKEWTFLEGVVLMRRNPEGQNQQEAGRTWFDEHACRCLLELDGVQMTSREQVMAAIDTWDAGTHRAMEHFFRKLDGPTGTELDAFDFFAPVAATSDEPSPSQ